MSQRAFGAVSKRRDTNPGQRMTVEEFLQSIPTFQHLSKEDVLKLTTQCRERTFEAGQHILSLHDVPVLAYVIHEGSVDVMKSDIVKRPTTKLEEIMKQSM